jgi:hypothetical protein
MWEIRVADGNGARHYELGFGIHYTLLGQEVLRFFDVIRPAYKINLEDT